MNNNKFVVTRQWTVTERVIMESDIGSPNLVQTQFLDMKETDRIVVSQQPVDNVSKWIFENLK